MVLDFTTVEATWTSYIVVQRCSETHRPATPFPAGICCTGCGLKRSLSHAQWLFQGQWPREPLAVNWDQHDRLETEVPRGSWFTSYDLLSSVAVPRNWERKWEGVVANTASKSQSKSPTILRFLKDKICERGVTCVKTAGFSYSRHFQVNDVKLQYVKSCWSN